jgi:hypothetical protein
MSHYYVPQCTDSFHDFHVIENFLKKVYKLRIFLKKFRLQNISSYHRIVKSRRFESILVLHGDRGGPFGAQLRVTFAERDSSTLTTYCCIVCRHTLSRVKFGVNLNVSGLGKARYIPI